MQTRPTSSPTKKTDVMPYRVRPLARLGTKAPTAMRTFEATRFGSTRVRQKCRALSSAPEARTNAPAMLKTGVVARVSASNAWPLTILISASGQTLT